MGVFKKLKDVLFDVEEEIPVITRDEKEPVVDQNPIKEIKMPKEEVVKPEPIVQKPVQKEEKFNFPLDFDDELPIRNRERDYFDDEIIKTRSSMREKDNFYEEKTVSKKSDYEYDYSRLNVNDKKKSENKQFKISPIISPVYGILDQNYTKDDVIVRSEPNKNPTLDDVRKKAYGSKKKVEPEVKKETDEFEEPLRTLDEILIDKDEKTKEINKEDNDYKIDDTPVYDDELPDEPFSDEVQEEVTDKEDNIESDLFNLIDSMYEERNERENEEW